MSAAERCVVTRTIAATPAEVFTVLADPSRHQDTEPTDWVRNAVDTAPITGAGQMFAMNMYLIAAGGDYVTHNLVHVFERDRAIAWMPGVLDDAGNPRPAAGSGVMTLCLTVTAPTSPSRTTGAARRRPSETALARCPSSARITSLRRWPLSSARSRVDQINGQSQFAGRPKVWLSPCRPASVSTTVRR